MAKKIKFPLEMKNGEKVTDMKELQENFDIEKIVGYFLDGKLKNWLDARYYEDEAEAIAQIDREDLALAKRLCEVFGVEYEDSGKIDLEAIAQREARIARLKQFTDDEEVIENIDYVAFNQEELATLYDNNIVKIYLCNGEFSIPKAKSKLKYIIVGNPVIKGLSQKPFGESNCTDYIHEEKYSSNKKISKLDESCISESLADLIGWNNYVITDEYVVFSNRRDSFRDILPKLNRDDSYTEDIRYFKMWNVATEKLSAFCIEKHEEYTELIESTGNKIILKKDFRANDVLVYDLDSKKSMIICENWTGDEETLSVTFDKIAYVDNNKNLYYVELENCNKVFVDNLNSTDCCVLITDNVIIYIKEEELFQYDFNERKISSIQKVDYSVKTLMAHNNLLYVINAGRNLSGNNYFIINEINLKDPAKRVKEIFKEKVSAWERKMLQRNPYFVLLKEEYGYPVYAFNSTLGIVKQIMSGCGYTESESHLFKSTDYFHYGYSFSVVGNYFFYDKSKQFSFDKNYHRINMITGEVAVQRNV